MCLFGNFIPQIEAKRVILSHKTCLFENLTLKVRELRSSQIHQTVAYIAYIPASEEGIRLRIYTLLRPPKWEPRALGRPSSFSQK